MNLETCWSIGKNVSSSQSNYLDFNNLYTIKSLYKVSLKKNRYPSKRLERLHETINQVNFDISL